MQTFLLFVLPAIEAIIIVVLTILCAKWKFRADVAEARLAVIDAKRARLVLPTKEQMEDHRKRHPDFRNTIFHNAPPPSVTATYKPKD